MIAYHSSQLSQKITYHYNIFEFSDLHYLTFMKLGKTRLSSANATRGKQPISYLALIYLHYY